MPYLLDTNICVYIIRGRQRSVVERFYQHTLSELLISSVTTAELYFGIEKSNRRERNLEVLETFLMPIAAQPFDYEASKIYGGLRVELERRGTLIAAHALSLGATLVTNNTREFERVSELRVEN